MAGAFDDVPTVVAHPKRGLSRHAKALIVEVLLAVALVAPLTATLLQHVSSSHRALACSGRR